MKKVLLKSVFLLVLLLSACAFTACGGDADTFFTEGDFTYRQIKSGEYEIFSYDGEDENLILPTRVKGGKVVAIGERAFAGNETLEGLSIGDGIQTIEKEAFLDCISLEKILISDTVLTIGDYAFSGCMQLFDITMPKKLSKVGVGTFKRCISLPKIELPDTVAYIGDYAFEGCVSLSSFKLPAQAATLGSAFIGCVSLVNVTLNKELRAIAPETFSSCHNLRSVSGGVNVTSIGRGAFRSCRSLVEFTMPQKLRVIDDEAFEGCHSLVTVMFFESVDASGRKVAAVINRGAFDGCTALKTVYYYYSGEEKKSLLSIEPNGNDALMSAELIFAHREQN